MNVRKPLRAVFNVLKMLKMLKEEGELGGTRSEAIRNEPIHAVRAARI